MSNKSLQERLLHAVSYEVTALMITIPGAALIMQRPMTHIGFTAVALALLAMCWNMLFNFIFDRFFPPRLPRNTGVRALQALGFEGGLIIFAVPLTAWCMDMSVSQALTMDIGFFLFYFPYTYVFNLIWDALVNYYLKHKNNKIGLNSYQ